MKIRYKHIRILIELIILVVLIFLMIRMIGDFTDLFMLIIGFFIAVICVWWLKYVFGEKKDEES